ncbi:MAG: ThiF family adenylyltransferase, partial [Candidatus Fimenecus sp.]
MTNGIGKIKIIDCDKVSITNLHRQTIYSESETDKPKTDAAKERLSKLNSSI